MGSLLFFSRNRCTRVEQVDETTLKSCCRLQDTLLEASVEIMVKLPDLEIAGARGEVHRGPGRIEIEDLDRLQKAVGVRIGPAMSKIIKGLIGREGNMGELAFMVEECCHGVILYFTKLELLKWPKEIKDLREHYAKMVRENIRLYNRCAAFAPGSSIVEGIEPPEARKEDEEDKE